jgi:hypothetical protein
MATQIDFLADLVFREQYVPPQVYIAAAKAVAANPPGSVQRFQAQRTLEILEACVLYSCRNANT